MKGAPRAPASGFRWPVMQLKSVVFPEPLGPMMPWMVPAATARPTPSRARSAQKDLQRPEIFRLKGAV